MLDIEFNNDDVKDAIKNISDAKKSIDQLTAANKALAAQGEKNSQAYVKNEQSIKALNSEVAANTKIVQSNSQANQQNANSIDALKAKNAEILKLRNQVDTSTLEGIKRIEELNAEYDKNSQIIANNSTNVEKQRFNIGNYASALEGVSPGLAKFASGLGATANSTGGVTSGFAAMTKASLGFIATPIGAVIFALVNAFKLLQTFIGGSTAGMDLFEDATAAVSTVVDVVVDRVVALVGGIGKLLSGDFSGGLDDITESFSGIGDEIEREIALTLDLNNAIRELEDAEINLDIAASKNAVTVKELLLQAKNRTLAEKDRIALLEQATKIEEEQNKQFVANKKEALRIANEEANKRIELARAAGETEEEFAQRLIDTGKLLDPLRDKVKDAIIAYNGALGEGVQVREKIQNQIDALAEKAEAEAEKRAEKRRKEIEDLAKLQAEMMERINAAENEQELIRAQRELAATVSLDDRTAKLIEIENLKRDQLLENQELIEQERQVIIQNSEDAITQIKLDSLDKQRAAEQEDLAEALTGYQEYVAGLINVEKQKLLDGKISQEDYNQEIEDLQIAALEMQLAIKQQYGEEDVALNGRIIDAKIAQQDKEVEITAKQQQAKKDAVIGAIGSIAGAFNKNSVAFKALSAAQTLIQTYQGATAAFTGMTTAIPGPVGIALGIAAAAAAVVSGLANVAKITNVQLPKLARGGMFAIPGRRHSAGGETLSIGNRAVAEVEGGETLAVVNRGGSQLLNALSTINHATGGVAFTGGSQVTRYAADGGIVARDVARTAAQLTPEAIGEAMKNFTVVAQISELERVQGNRDAAISFSELS